jgi:hypothetical protein
MALHVTSKIRSSVLLATENVRGRFGVSDETITLAAERAFESSGLRCHIDAALVSALGARNPICNTGTSETNGSTEGPSQGLAAAVAASAVPPHASPDDQEQTNGTSGTIAH